MGTFDSFADAAFQLKTEGEQITLNFKQGVPVSGQGTVSWNIPTPAHGCNNEDDSGAYAGMVILLSTTPLTAANIPNNGTVYHADPTADTDVHTGDTIGGALVVGAIYECETKGQGGELTTSLVITDLDPNIPYYVAGYAADCQFRYHSDGQRAYSDEYGNGDEPDTPGRQVISFESNRILPTDGTDLVAGITYAFDLVVDRNAPNGTDFDVVEINVDGINVGTYADLLESINNQIKLVNNPPQSPIAPNTGAFFWDAVGQKLFQWDGSTHVEVPVIIEATDPTNVTVGTYWWNHTTDELKIRTAGSPDTWVDVTHVDHIRDPRNPTAADYWFDGTIGRSWNGATWCDVSTSLNVTDPSVCEEPVNGTYWYDTVNGVLSERNTEAKIWETRAAITWNEDPTNLSPGTYWFDLNTNVLNIKVVGSPSEWNVEPVSIQETEPATPTNGDLWYVPSTEELFEYVDTGSPAAAAWVERNVLVWPGDPSDTTSCDLWWDTTDDTLYAWDSQNLEWDQVVSFIMSDTDPALSPVIVVDSLWWDGTTLKKWDGSGWEDVDTIEHLTDPTLATFWHDTVNEIMYQWSGSWVAMNPIDSDNDPTALPVNTYWFNTTNNTLNMFNGAGWVNISYTTVPLTPTRGDKWFDTVNGILYEWNGTSYIEIAGIATVAINSRGQIVFTGAEGGSSQVVLIPVPENATSGSLAGCASVGTGFADFGQEGVSPATCSFNTLSGEVNYPTRDIPISGYLWDHVMPMAFIQEPTEGVDGLSGLPSYDVVGVGDDGTPDERRELADSLRAQLGYPVVDVELTPYQIDTAIQGALESLRKRSSAGYKRGFFFLDVRPGQSNYVLNNNRIGYNKIVNVTEIRRFTSAFLSTAHGAGVYGQVVLQHLYNMGTYDLTSFHLVSQYVEQLEHLFATRIVYNWNEDQRQLNIFQSFSRPERLLLDCTIERTEQDLLKDRYVKSWLERYALSECQFILAQIRGKYTSLPGAGGGISLNAAELTALAESNRAELIEQIDDYIVNDLEGQGQGGTFVIG